MARLTSKGQVTIPKRVRDYLGLKPGSTVEFAVTADFTGDVALFDNQEAGVEADR